MITFDGDRSKRRAWFAKKQLAIVKALDVPGKVLQWDGFTFKVWQQGELSGGHVMAPMGAVVAYSNYLGIQLCVADHWCGAFTGKSYHYGLTSTVTAGYGLTDIPPASEEEMIAGGFSTFKNMPIPFQSPYNMKPVGYTDPPNTYYDLDDMPTPWVSAIPGAEAFWMAYSSMPQLEPLRDFFEISRFFYSSNGSNLSGRVTGLYEQAIDLLNVHGSKALYPLPSTGLQMVEVQPQQWPFYNGDRIQAVYYSGDINGITHSIWYLSTILQNMPAGLRSVVLSATDTICSCVGNYIFSTAIDGPPTMLTAIDLTDQISYGGSVKDWFDNNPGNDHWQLSYHFHTWGESTVYTQHSGAFMSVLDTMAAVHSPQRTSPSSDYVEAAWVMAQLFARPNHNFSVPYDNAMWNDGAGNVYSWSRLYGAYQWTTAGISSITVTFNSIIHSTAGVRPTISYAGNDLYLCAGEYVGKPTRIHCIDVGSPFTGVWQSLPLPESSAEETRHLVYIRSVQVIENHVILIGVIERIVTGEEGVYHLAFLEYKENAGAWIQMAQIPATRSYDEFAGTSTEEYANWSVTLFGVGKLAKLIGQYLTQQPVMTQMPIPVAYSGYESGMP